MAERGESESTVGGESTSSYDFIGELTSPINLVLLGICVILIYKIFKRNSSPPKPKPSLPKLKKDMTLEEIKQYDGKGKDERILIAVNGKIFDVTAGKRFYGQGAPYGVFAGRDASRGLATFSLTGDVLKDEYDDLSDLNSMQMESVKEWEMQFTEKYEYVGKLLKPGEKPEISDGEEEQSDKSKTE